MIYLFLEQLVVFGGKLVPAYAVLVKPFPKLCKKKKNNTPISHKC